MTLIAELEAAIGAAHVMTGADAAPYGKDWTGAYTATPLAVLRPKNTAEVAAIMQIAHASGTAVVPAAGRTGLTGATLAEGALMLSVERLNKITEINRAARTATVGAGVILSHLHDAAAEEGLIFPLTLGARGSAMIGGLLSTNAGGINVVRYGSTRGLCLGLEVVMADGQVMNLMSALHKDNAGYDLKNLMIGAEGTLGIITAAVLRLMPMPKAYATAMLAVPSLPDALQILHRLQAETGNGVEAFEYMPRSYIDLHRKFNPDMPPPFERGYDINIMVEIAATKDSDAIPGPDGRLPLAVLFEETLGAMLESGQILDAVIAQSEAQRQQIWKRREDAGEVAFFGGTFVNTDIAVPLDKLAEFETRLTPKLRAIDPQVHEVIVAHLGDGNIHHTSYISRNDPQVISAMTEAVEDVVAELGGSFSAEHGIGVSKLDTMARRKDPTALAAMQAVKTALDPQGILNPGKVLPAS